MDNFLTLVVLIVALAVLYVVLPVVADAYGRFQSPKVVTCPETHARAEVRLDAARAAASAAFGKPELRVVRCSRWAERHYCDQHCVEQLS